MKLVDDARRIVELNGFVEVGIYEVKHFFHRRKRQILCGTFFAEYDAFYIAFVGVFPTRCEALQQTDVGMGTDCAHLSHY